MFFCNFFECQDRKEELVSALSVCGAVSNLFHFTNFVWLLLFHPNKFFVLPFSRPELEDSLTVEASFLLFVKFRCSWQCCTNEF